MVVVVCKKLERMSSVNGGDMAWVGKRPARRLGGMADVLTMAADLGFPVPVHISHLPLFFVFICFYCLFLVFSVRISVLDASGTDDDFRI